jgi:nucleoside 2-deoxyribosyltransferase
MKTMIVARYKGIENKEEIEALCAAVKSAGMEDRCFIRDIENYEKVYDDPKDLWASALKEISACDALLIDVSDQPTGGRVVEAGIAYGQGKPIFVIVKNGISYKEVFDGIATVVIRYDEFSDIVAALSKYA